MKRISFIIIGLLICVLTFAQEKKDKKLDYADEIEGVNVTPPIFMGAERLRMTLQDEEFTSLNDYMKSQIVYPEKSKKWLDEGTEVIAFTVSEKGEVSNFQVINSVSPEIDEEVIRVIKTTDRMWNPGSNNGTPIAMEKEVSVVFNIGIDLAQADQVAFDSVAKRYFKKGNKKLFFKQDTRAALKNYDKAICYLPNDKCLLISRGMCRYELGDTHGACTDWNRIKTLGGSSVNYDAAGNRTNSVEDDYLQNFCGFKGYAELKSILQDN
ncbi:MAG: energy transducer TonB [Prolixibacteraceae bacterium]